MTSPKLHGHDKDTIHMYMELPKYQLCNIIQPAFRRMRVTTKSKQCWTWERDRETEAAVKHQHAGDLLCPTNNLCTRYFLLDPALHFHVSTTLAWQINTRRNTASLAQG